MWKQNWEETKINFTDWWNQKGLVIGMWGPLPADKHFHEDVSDPATKETRREFYTHPLIRANRNHYNLSRQAFPGDTLPMCETDIGPGSLALFCGCEATIAEDTIWFDPVFENVENPEKIPAFTFDSNNKWWRLTEDTIRECKKISKNNYLIGIPDLFDNLDTLSSLRGAQTLLFDMLERPDWVDQKLKEIHAVWIEAFERIYQLSKHTDDSSSYGAFRLWAPGRTSLMQCDAAAMISPEMFERFAVPHLKDQCERLEYTMYHVDGTQALIHLDAVLEIEKLRALEWSPQAGIEEPGDPRWYDLYRRILAAGKSVQVCGAKPEEIIPVLDAIGGKGVYIIAEFANEKEAEEILKKAESYRK
jgi:hypothetical protein